MTARTQLLVLISILLGIVAGSPVAVAAEPEALIGRDYSAARKILIKEHWILLHHSEVQTMEYDKKVQRKYPEMDGCAMDKPVCSFSFKKAGRCMRVITWGEEIEAFTVNAIVHDCWDATKR
jgi:hypothetical protein